MIRPQARPDDSGGQEWFPVKSKAHSPDAYPTSGAAAGWVLPCVYVQSKFAFGDASLTDQESPRQDLVFSNIWHPEGTRFMATRIGERLYGIPLPNGLYSVRSYKKAGVTGAGQTNWTADYWKGSTGSFTASSTGAPFSNVFSPNGGDVLRVAVDASDDIYVGGPRATATGGASHWNLIKYDGSTGAEVWKVDIDTGRASGATGNIWAVLFNPLDGLIYIHSDARGTGSSAFTGGYKINTSDGSVNSSYGTGTSSGLLWDGSVVQNTPMLLSHAGPTSPPYYQAIAGGKLVTLGQFRRSSDPGSQLVVDPLPLGFTPYRQYLIQDFASWPYGSGQAVDMIVGGTDRLLAVSCNPIYFNNPTDIGRLALLDTGLDTTTYPITYRWKNTSTSHIRTQLKFQDASYLVTGSGGSGGQATVDVLNVSDGSKVFGHYHLQPTGIAVSSSAIVTVGTRKSFVTDQDFV